MARSASSSIRFNNRVLIVTDDVEAARDTVSGLRSLDLDVQLARFDGTDFSDLPSRAPSAVLCFLSDYVEASAEIVAELKAKYAPRDVPFIGRLSRAGTAPLPFDSVLFAPVHAVQLAQRVAGIIRLGQMETEILRRMDTMRETFGRRITLKDRALREPFRILFIGKASPSYMAVINALKDKNVEVTAAFTSFSAFDYLHDHQFDAVIMNALDQSEPALTITEAMRRNAKLYHVPVLYLVNEDYPDRDAAFDKGARDLIEAKAEPEEIAGRVLELANYHRVHAQLKAEFSNLTDPAWSDPETGVFNADFLSAHLRRVSRDCRKSQSPLTVLTLRLKPETHANAPEAVLRAAYAKATRLIAKLVRMQDIVARLASDTVVIVFPEETAASIERVLERMYGLIDCAAFDPAPGQDGPLMLSIDAAIMEQEAFEDSDLLIGNAVRKMDDPDARLTKRGA